MVTQTLIKPGLMKRKCVEARWPAVSCKFNLGISWYEYLPSYSFTNLLDTHLLTNQPWTGCISNIPQYTDLSYSSQFLNWSHPKFPSCSTIWLKTGSNSWVELAPLSISCLRSSEDVRWISHPRLERVSSLHSSSTAICFTMWLMITNLFHLIAIL